MQSPDFWSRSALKHRDGELQKAGQLKSASVANKRLAPTKVRQRAVEAEIAVGRRYRWGHLHLHGGIDSQTTSGGFTLSLRDPLTASACKNSHMVSRTVPVGPTCL